MNLRSIRSRRSLRSEMLPVSVVLSIPLILAWIFPYCALMPTSNLDAGAIGATPASCAFAELDEIEEAAAIVAARTAWHVNSEGVKSLRIEMFADDLPEDASGPVLEIRDRTRVSHGVAIGYETTMLPSDLRAAAPSKLEKPAPPAKPLPFPKDELLKLD